MELKPPLSYSEQVDKLIKHGMIVKNRKKAERILSCVNYYRLTGYALPYREDSSGERYKAGTSFDQVLAIYEFDRELRATLYTYIEQVEIYFRAQISNGFAMERCMVPPYNAHYDESNFKNKKGYREVMDSLEKEEHRNRDSLIVKHHEKV